MKNFEDLSDGCLLEIFKYLDEEAIKSTMLTSKRNYEILSSTSEYIRKRRVKLKVNSEASFQNAIHILQTIQRKYEILDLQFVDIKDGYKFLDLFKQTNGKFIKNLNICLEIFSFRPSLGQQPNIDFEIPPIKTLKIYNGTPAQLISFSLSSFTLLTHFQIYMSPENHRIKRAKLNLDQLINLRFLKNLDIFGVEIESSLTDPGAFKTSAQLSELRLIAILFSNPLSEKNFLEYMKSQNSISDFCLGFGYGLAHDRSYKEFALHLIQLPSLKSFSIQNKYINDQLCATDFINPNVQVLNVGIKADLAQLAKRFPNVKETNLIADNFPELNHFTNIEKYVADRFVNIKSVFHLISLPNLKDFTFDDCNFEIQVTPESFIDFLRRHPKLKILKVRDINYENFQKSDVDGFVLLLKDLIKLELNLSKFENEEIGEEFVKCISRNCLQLKELKLKFRNEKERTFAVEYFKEKAKKFVFYSSDIDC